MQTRMWMALGTLIQTLFTMSAAIALWRSGSASVADNRGDPTWTNTLSFVAVAFISASMGLQGIMGKRLNTQFTTTGTCPSAPLWRDRLTLKQWSSPRPSVNS